jgi:hypothetical protein
MCVELIGTKINKETQIPNDVCVNYFVTDVGPISRSTSHLRSKVI